MTIFDVSVEPPVINVEVSESITDVILIAGPSGPVGPAAAIRVDVIEGGDGATTSFLLSQATTSDSSVQVFRNGLAEVNGIGFLVETAATTAVTFTTAPLDTDVITVTYQI